MVCCGRRRTLPDGTGGEAVSDIAVWLFALWIVSTSLTGVAHGWAIKDLRRRMKKLEGDGNAE